MTRLLPLEQPDGILRQFDNLYAFVQIGFVRFPVPLDLAIDAILLSAPLVRHLLEESRVDQAVEFVDIHGVDTVLEPPVLGLEPLGRLVVLAALVGVAGMQGISHPVQHLVVELQPAQQFGELPFEHLLAHIFATAGGRVAPALIGVAGAVIVNVPLFLDLPDHGAPAGTTCDQPRECEVTPASLRFPTMAAVENSLHPLPKVDRDEGLVLSLDELAVPLELARVEPIAQDGVNGAYRYLGAALSMDKARILRPTSRFL